MKSNQGKGKRSHSRRGKKNDDENDSSDHDEQSKPKRSKRNQTEEEIDQEEIRTILDSLKRSNPKSIINEKDKKENKKNTKQNKKDDTTFEQPIIIPVFLEHNNNENEESIKKRNGKRETKVDDIRKRILNSNIEEKTKTELINRLQHIDSDKQKQLEWFESLLRIPFKKYTPLPITRDHHPERLQSYFEKVNHILNQSVYGMASVKEEIINYIAQFISTNNTSQPRILGLRGNPGVGKTEICTSGLSSALERPIKTVSLGGIRDSSHFVGFDYTYSGSRYGLIVQMLIDTGVMNPILFFDEVDKISQAHDGIEVQNLLIHLTDPVQNMNFQDKYFSGIPIDLSRVVFVFSFNDETLLNPILKDRIHVINVPDPSIDEKIIISRDYLSRQIAKNVGISIDDIKISDDAIRYIIKEYCNKDKGIRGIKRCIETLFLKINTSQYLGIYQKYKCLRKKELFPLTITNEIIDELIKENHSQKEDWHLSHMYL